MPNDASNEVIPLFTLTSGYDHESINASRHAHAICYDLLLTFDESNGSQSPGHENLFTLKFVRLKVIIQSLRNLTKRDIKSMFRASSTFEGAVRLYIQR